MTLTLHVPQRGRAGKVLPARCAHIRRSGASVPLQLTEQLAQPIASVEVDMRARSSCAHPGDASEDHTARARGRTCFDRLAGRRFACLGRQKKGSIRRSLIFATVVALFALTIFPPMIQELKLF